MSTVSVAQVRTVRVVAPLLVLLGATAVLYLWGLDVSGWGNRYYAAAAQAGSRSWKAFFFGSFDAAGAITVDKTPLSLWPMALSVRVFGLGSWSLLVPQALEGVATVGLLYASVRRTTGSVGAGLLAGAALATTPVAALVFRFDIPDALLVLLLVASAWATLRAVSSPRPLAWLLLAGAFVGAGFLSKMLEAFLVLPALGLAWLGYGCAPLSRRLAGLGVGLVGVVAGAAWWLLPVALWPAADRPWIGGSAHNSVIEVALGYNGLGRLDGQEHGHLLHSTSAGPLRMLDPGVGGGIAWLLPAALVLGVAAWWWAGRIETLGRGRPRAVRAGLVLWLVWLVGAGLTLSLMQGIFHTYYAVLLAPAAAALVAVASWTLWSARARGADLAIGVGILLATSMPVLLLSRTPDFLPGLGPVLAVVGVVAAAGVVLGRPRSARVAGAAALGLVASLVGPLSFSVATAAEAHGGIGPTAGPVQQVTAPEALARLSAAPLPLLPPLEGDPAASTASSVQAWRRSLDQPLVTLLEGGASGYRWVAATTGYSTASDLQLATEHPVMLIGGFNGSDPSPSLAQFRELVATHQVHYYVPSHTPVTRGTTREIAGWVTDSFRPTEVGGRTVYDLSAPTTPAGTSSPAPGGGPA
ncbi:MAG: glycosyl transferase [Acidobacteria bacterium]|nr:MAG: glycosyl transferase [Acidobacteriota bacterium]